MVNKKVTLKRKLKQTKQKKSLSNKNYKKFVKARNAIRFTNRTQIGCSNNRKKVMIGGGVNAISQPIENIGYNIIGGINTAYNTIFGYPIQHSSDVAYQPYLV